MNLRIIKAGVLDTIQDLGRYGAQHQGINPGGAMDKFAAQVANCLVGNDPQTAVIELHFPPSAFFFEQPALIAISGADFSANINGEEVECLQPVIISRYSILQFHGIRKGARAYLAIHGGLDIKPWLNSCSTNLKAGAGGHKGRALQKDDEIGLLSNNYFTDVLGKLEFLVLPWKTDNIWLNKKPEEIFVIKGPEFDRLDKISSERFFYQSFSLSSHSDRMGYQLKGEPLRMTEEEEMLSAAVGFGTVQLLPDGQVTVLMADHQTTGGYPRLAHVITAHHSCLAQLQPGDAIHFRDTDQATAEQLMVLQQQHLLQLQNACKFRLDKLLLS